MTAKIHLRGFNAAASIGPGPTHEVIARLAEFIWEREGRPSGRDVEFWLRAEAALKEPSGLTCHEIPS